MTAAAHVGRFVHPALFYRSDDEYLATLVPFVTEGVELDQPVAVAVPGQRLRLLRTALGDLADRVRMIDMVDAGRNPGRIIAGVLRRFADRHVDRHVRIIGEPIWHGRSATEYPACVQHEALINAAFADRDVTIVCPYDTTTLEPHVVADAHATHPLVWEADRRYPSDRYAPDSVIERYNETLEADADAVGIPVTTLAEIRRARRVATVQAQRLGLDGDRVADFELIAAELVTNSLVHAKSPCELRIWHDDGHLICEVRDNGRLADPLAGRRPPGPEQRGGRGLLLVNDLADLVRMHIAPHGTTIRALLRVGWGHGTRLNHEQ